jgi:hypothetical protein
MRKINGTTTRDTSCRSCGAALPKGTRVAIFRERATSSAEARNAGSLYVRRVWCAPCAER